MRTLTVDLILSWSPCGYYSRNKLQELFGEKTEATLLEVLDDTRVYEQDRVWVAQRLLSLQCYRPVWVEWACQCVESVLPTFLTQYPQDTTVVAAIEGARLYLKGRITRDNLVARQRAARNPFMFAEYTVLCAYTPDAEAWAAYVASHCADFIGHYSDCCNPCGRVDQAKKNLSILRRLIETSEGL